MEAVVAGMEAGGRLELHLPLVLAIRPNRDTSVEHSRRAHQEREAMKWVVRGSVAIGLFHQANAILLHNGHDYTHAAADGVLAGLSYLVAFVAHKGRKP